MRRTEWDTSSRITVEALRFYVPLFHQACQAEEKLLKVEDIPAAERNHLETVARWKKLTTDRIAALSGPLITRELSKILKSSTLNDEDLFDILYYAGIDGMMKGLRKFDVEKINTSSTNYLFQWILTYAKKELLIMEAPFGIPPSRYQKFKKISAVRQKMTTENGREPSNEEVLEYFHNGSADVKTMNGRVRKSNKLYASNQNMTLDLIKEQEEFATGLRHTETLDPLEDYSSEVKFSSRDDPMFRETLFGAFLDSYNFTIPARAVLMSDLSVRFMPSEESYVLEGMTSAQYKHISFLFKELLKDRNGPFSEFLSEHMGQFDDLDMRKTLNSIMRYKGKAGQNRYMNLFEQQRIERI